MKKFSVIYKYTDEEYKKAIKSIDMPGYAFYVLSVGSLIAFSCHPYVRI